VLLALDGLLKDVIRIDALQDTLPISMVGHGDASGTLGGRPNGRPIWSATSSILNLWGLAMKHDGLLQRLRALELSQAEPMEIMLRWLEPGEEPGPNAICLRWLDEDKP
jgi:hypothetical protein